MSPRWQSALPWALALVCLVFDPSALADAPKRSAALLLGLALLVPLLAHRSPLPLPTLYACGAVAFIAVASVHGSGPRWALLGNWWLLVTFSLGLSGLDVEAAKRVTARSALLVASATSLWLLGEGVLGARGMQLHAGQGNPNWAGLLLSVAWPLAASDSLVSIPAAASDALVSRKRVACALGLGFACALALAFTQSRVAWVAAACGWGSALLRRGWRRRAFVNLLLLLVGIGITSWPSPAPTRSPGPAAASVRRAPESNQSASASLSGRVWIQRVALERALREQPWGAGLGGFFPAFLEQQGRSLNAFTPRQANQKFSNATTAHNDWLELLFETGPLAPVLLFVALALAVRGGEPYHAASLVTGGVCALGDSPFHLPALQVLTACIFASLPRNGPGFGKRAIGGLALVGCALLLSQSLAGWFSSRLASAARAEAPSLRRKLLERAARLQPESSERALELGLARRDTGELPGALEALERAVALGGDVASFVALGNAALDVNTPAQARVAFEGALARSPGSVRAHVGLGEALRRLGELDAAERHMRVASELLPGDLELRARLDALREQRLDRALELPSWSGSNGLGEPSDSR